MTNKSFIIKYISIFLMAANRNFSYENWDNYLQNNYVLRYHQEQ